MKYAKPCLKKIMQMMQENNTQDVETPVRLAKNVIENFSKLF